MAVAVSGRRAGELEAGPGPAGRRLRAKLAERAFREGVRAELATPTKFRLFNGEWAKVQVVEVAPRRAPRPTSSAAIDDIARSEGRDPLDVMLDLALDENLQTVFTAQLLNSDEAAVGRMLNHPHSLVSAERRGRAPDLLQRRRFRPAPARATGRATAV